MKYRHQPISQNAVQIELVPDDEQDRNLIKILSKDEPDEDTLRYYYQQGLRQYRASALLMGLDFVEYPSNAICSFDVVIG